MYTREAPILKNADLIVPFTACPFGTPEEKCPFIKYYSINDREKQIENINFLAQEKLDELRKFHQSCMQKLKESIKVHDKDFPFY